MKMKKIALLSLGMLMSVSLAACASKTTNTETESTVEPRQIVAKHSDTRLKFNQIVLAKEKDEFKGGTNLAKLKELFGEPKSHEEVPAGDVKLDAYYWSFDQMDITVQLYEDSAIVRSLSHFTFIRDAVNGLEQFNQLEKGMTFRQTVDLLGEPDVYSEAVSSDHEQLQAIWSSGLKTSGSGGQIDLIFENGKLSEFHQVNLVD